MSYEQPMVLRTVVAPSSSLGDLMTMLQRRDGTQTDLSLRFGCGSSHDEFYDKTYIYVKL